MSTDYYTNPIPRAGVNAVRTGLIIASLVGIVLGLVAIFQPGPTVVVISWLFGIALVILGLVRVYFAFAAAGLGVGLRILSVILGVLLVLFGVLAIAAPGSEGAWLLAVWIGVGWIIGGLSDLFGSREIYTSAPRWLVIIGALISIIAGIIVLFSYGAALETLAFVGGLLLVVFAIVTLFNLPPKVD